jgi:hypothetical protein
MIWICKFFLSAEKTPNSLNRDPVNNPFSCSLFSGIWNGQLNAVAKSLWADSLSDEHCQKRPAPPQAHLRHLKKIQSSWTRLHFEKIIVKNLSQRW